MRTEKKIKNFGVEMTSLEISLFSKYLTNNGIAMNTKTKEERGFIAEDWLKKKNMVMNYEIKI